MAKFLIQDVFSIEGRGTIPVGLIEEGTLRIGMKADLEGKIVEIKSIEVQNKQIDQAETGTNAGILLAYSTSDNPIQEQRSWIEKLLIKKDDLKEAIKKYRGTSIDFN